MTAGFLLDANIVSEPIKPRPNKNVIRRMEAPGLQLAIASVVWHELLFGCYRLPKSAKRSAIEEYLDSLGWPILPYSEQAAQWHAAERARLTALGRTPPFTDGQIAAIAATNNLILVTANTEDFVQFKGLDVVDWRK